MKIIYGFETIPAMRHPVATVGSYDGVHRGHQALIGEVVRRAATVGGEALVLTFEPHPRITLQQCENFYLLSSLEEKAALLERYGVDYMVVIPFDTTFSRLSHEEFIGDYIIGRLGIKELVVGYNHRFGHNKSGNYNYLATKEGELRVTEIGQHTVDDDKVSSTVIREVIANGDMAQAERLSGHPYIIIGMADDGGKLLIDRYKLLPPTGIYNATVNGVRASIEIMPDGKILTCAKAQKNIIEL
jgi:riboflavin kinase/FMN adenylyltransferase